MQAYLDEPSRVQGCTFCRAAFVQVECPWCASQHPCITVLRGCNLISSARLLLVSCECACNAGAHMHLSLAIQSWLACCIHPAPSLDTKCALFASGQSFEMIVSVLIAFRIDLQLSSDNLARVTSFVTVTRARRCCEAATTATAAAAPLHIYQPVHRVHH